ncbi:MAG: HEAT repeat domain-containing protein [Planctomycetota bacterium]|nr:HEAT repeat domain-containing protein [Planctomycetota bacterium]
MPMLMAVTGVFAASFVLGEEAPAPDDTEAEIAEFLVNGLAYPQKQVRKEVLQGLEPISNLSQACAPRLLEALRNADEDGVRIARLYLRSVPDPMPAVEDLKKANDLKRLACLLAAAVEAKPMQAGVIVALCDHPDKDLRSKATFALNRMTEGSVAVLPEQLKAIQGSDRTLRKTTLASLYNKKLGPSAVPALVSALKDDDPEIRRMAAMHLANIGPAAQGAIKDLMAGLDDRDSRVRSLCLRALGQIGGAGLPELVRALEHEDPGVRMLAIGSLGDAGQAASATLPEMKKACEKDPALWPYYWEAAAKITGNPGASAEAYAEILRKPELGLPKETWAKVVMEKDKALQMLGEMGEDAAEAIPAISEELAILDNPNRPKTNQHFETAVYALMRIGRPAAASVRALVASSNETKRDLVTRAMRAYHMDPKPLDMAAELAGDKDVEVRRWVAKCLTENPAGNASKARVLGILMNDADAEIRSLATANLRRLKSAAGLQSKDLLLGLKNPDAKVRRQAALALARQGALPEEGAPLLVDAVRSGSTRDERVAAYAALAEYPAHAKALTTWISDRFKAKELDSVEASAMVDLLSRLLPESQGALVEALSCLAARDRAAQALGTLGAKVVPALVAVISGANNKNPIGVQGAAMALAFVGEPAAESLVGLLRAQDHASSEAAKTAFRAMGGPAVPRLVKMAEDDTDPRLAICAWEILGGMGPSAKPAVPQALKRASSGPEVARIAAINLLVSVDPDDPESQKVLLASLRDPSAVVRIGATRALVFRHVAIGVYMNEFENMLQDKNPQVRTWAVYGLGELGSRGSGYLAKALADPEPSVRNVAASRLTNLKSLALPTLAKVIRGKDEQAREAATQALAQMGPLAAIVWADAMRDPMAEVRNYATAQLTKLGEIGKPGLEIHP